MKNIIHILLVALVATGLFSGCRATCKDIDCTNGLCTEGDCHCNDGFEMINDHCIDSRNFYTGTYLILEHCNNVETLNDTLVITKGTNPKDIILSGTLKGTVSDSREQDMNKNTIYRFSVPAQGIVQSGINCLISGEGSVTNKKVSFSYTLYTDNVTANCNFHSK